MKYKIHQIQLWISTNTSTNSGIFKVPFSFFIPSVNPQTRRFSSELQFLYKTLPWIFEFIEYSFKSIFPIHLVCFFYKFQPIKPFLRSFICILKYWNENPNIVNILRKPGRTPGIKQPQRLSLHTRRKSNSIDLLSRQWKAEWPALLPAFRIRSLKYDLIKPVLSVRIQIIARKALLSRLLLLHSPPFFRFDVETFSVIQFVSRKYILDELISARNWIGTTLFFSIKFREVSMRLIEIYHGSGTCFGPDYTDFYGIWIKREMITALISFLNSE